MQRFTGTAWIAGLAALLAMAVAAKADEPPRCLAIAPVLDVPAAAIPPTLGFVLKTDIGAYALPGEDFDATDVVQTRIHHRLMWVRRHGIRWVVAVENGGYAYNQSVFAYDMPPGGPATRIGRVGAQAGFVCQMTERQLWRPEDESGGLIAPVR
jgi:hypothetical protein